ncbi:ABC transporter permease [Pseudonocardia sp. NPDC046786]|uniref:ABC transporter permease n=1 Tax=Pseudonocardia sp. NPDC046786 TaxID=3155471 RepID=UPI003410104B
MTAQTGVTAALRRERVRVVSATVLRKLLSGVVVLWAAVTLTFFSVHLAPGDPVTLLMGENITPEFRAAVIADWQLDQPLWQQYLSHLLRIASGDLGTSFVQQQPVNAVLGARLWPTVALTAAAVVVAVGLAVAGALLTAGRPRWMVALPSTLELVLASVPSFWLGILLLTAFSFQFALFPVAGTEGVRALVLPALTLALPLAAVLSQVMRGGLERALEQPFAVTARSRGVSPWEVRTRHGLRHSLLPAVTLTGWAVGGLLNGTVITEQVFGRPGLGQATVQAVTQQDIPVVLAVVLLSVVFYVVVSTVVDLLYLLVDPRLRRSGT